MRHECAETADDVLWRRSKLGLRLGADAERGARRVSWKRAAAAPRLSTRVVYWRPRCRAHLLAIDQGTTSTRAFLFDEALRPVGFAQHEFPQIYPAPGWVEHDPQDIWTTSVATARAAMASAGVAAEDVAAIGITNQRETTIIWDRATGKPIHNAIVWQDRRTHDACAALARAGHEKLVTRAHRAAARSVFLGHQDRLAARQRARARARRRRPAGSPSARSTRFCCGS